MKLRPRYVAVLLAIMAGSWLVHQQTAYRERLTIRVDAAEITLLLHGREIKHPYALGRVERLRVATAETFEQFGGGWLKLRRPGQPEVFHPFPARWAFTGAGRAPPVGDWWVDRAQVSEDLTKLALGCEPPFELEAEIPGRVLQAFRFVFEGSGQLEVCIRSGLLNNDLSISRPPAEILAAWSIGGPWQRDLRHSVEPLVKGVFMAATALLCFAFLGCLPGQSRGPAWSSPWQLSVLAVGLVVARLAFSCWVATAVFGALPSFQDDLCYYLRARWLLAGLLDLPEPPVSDQLNIPFTAFRHGRWFTPYPVNWSLLLSAGMAFGVPWLVSPICGALSVWGQYRFGTDLAGQKVGLLAAILLATSPFCVVLSGSMMSHASTTMLLVFFAWGFVRAWPDDGNPRLALLVASGAALGFAFGIRPLTGAAVGLPTLLLGLWEWRRSRVRARAFIGLCGFALGVGLGMTTTLLDNWVVTGNPLLFAYAYREPFPDLASRFPFGAFWTDKSMAQLPMLMSGWGWPWVRGEWWLCLPFAFAFVPFFARQAGRHDWFALGLFFSVVLAHLSHNHGTIHGFGPRVYIDTLFALFFLTARGLQCLARPSPVVGPGPWPRRVAALLAFALPLSTMATLHRRISGYRGYNEIDRTQLQAIERLGTARGLFLLRADALPKWIRAAPLLPLDPVTSPYVFAELREKNDDVIAAYGKDRPVFIVEEGGRIIPYSAAAAATP
ncbi:MAG: glycosyltransferase family 39 protein [Verrucomicrobia bacterium]|nr:glycosyltransferase family 39 protein [Verrucomicrobiota bacterium]